MCHVITSGLYPLLFAQELMCRGADLVDVLRLMVLLCTMQQGLQKRHLDPLRLEVLHSYGHEHLTTLNALEKAGEGSEATERD